MRGSGVRLPSRSNMTTQEFEKELDSAYARIKNILIEKNKSYGFSVFQGSKSWQLLGNVMRVGDKYRRYEHIMQKYIDCGSKDAPFGETLNDTLLDLLGYALIGNVIANQED